MKINNPKLINRREKRLKPGENAYLHVQLYFLHKDEWNKVETKTWRS